MQTVINTSIRTDFTVSRQNDDTIHIQSAISNNTAAPIADLILQFAVTRVSLCAVSAPDNNFTIANTEQGYTLKLQPQSGRMLQPNQQNGITQNIHLHGVERGKGSAVKMRWKASYMLGPERKEEQGEISSLGVS